MQNIIRIPRNELRALFSNPKIVNGNTIISMDTCTTPTLTGGKKNPMKDLVRKITLASTSQIFQNQKTSSYASKVKRNMAKEGKNPDDFQVKPRVWGERVPNTPIIEHTNKAGVYTEYLETLGIKAGKVSYQLEGKDIAKDDVEGLKINTYGTQGGQEKIVIINNFKFASILSFRLDKQSYLVED